jgi:hypothetical protein
MADIIFPAIKERTYKIIAEYNKKFDGKHYLIDIPIDTPVMIKIPGGRPTALSPLYTGPYTVVRKTSAGTYVLKDESNELLHRDYVPSELKVVSMDESAIEKEHFEVEEIRDHKNKDGQRLYLVKWVGYGERENDWLPAEFFSSPITIKQYWDKVRRLEKIERERISKKSAEKSSKKNTISDRETEDVSNKRKRANNIPKTSQSNQQKKSNQRSRKNTIQERN